MRVTSPVCLHARPFGHRNPDTAAGVQCTVRPLATSIVLMLFVAAIPAATICCVDRTACDTTMQASMPCCAGSCTMTAPNPGHDNDAALTAAPSLRMEAGPAAAM